MLDRLSRGEQASVEGGRALVLLHNLSAFVRNPQDGRTLLALWLFVDRLEDLLHDPEPDKKAKEVELKILRRLRKHGAEKQFIELGERLEALRDRHEQGSVDH